MRLVATITALACATAMAEAPAPTAPESSPRTLELTVASVWIPGSDAPTPVGPGCYLRQDVCEKTGRDLVSLRAENASLQRAPESGTSVVVVLILTALALGGGYAAGRLIR